MLLQRTKRWVFVFSSLLMMFMMTGCPEPPDGEEPDPSTVVTVIGTTGFSPRQEPTCQFIPQNGGERFRAVTANDRGEFVLFVEPGGQGFVRCRPQALVGLTLSTFVSTVGMSAGETISDEDVTLTTTIIADLIDTQIFLVASPIDPTVRKRELLADIARGGYPLKAGHSVT